MISHADVAFLQELPDKRRAQVVALAAGLPHCRVLRLIEDPTGEIDWHFADDKFEEFINDTLPSIDAMVVGPVAYEKLAQCWPTADSNQRRRSDTSRPLG